MALERSGGCLCGAVRYQIDADPLMARVCWCKDCQHLAANGTVNAFFPSESVAVTGETATFERPAASGNVVRRRFCAQCGSHLFAEAAARPGVTVVRVGTLDDPSSIAPTVNIWASSAPPWACLDASLRRVENQP